MPSTATPLHPAAVPTPGMPVVRSCKHCCGSGREPAAPLDIDLSTRGEQVRLAKELGVSPSTLCRILSGQRGPGLLTLIRIARRYHTTVDRVLRLPAIWRRIHEQVE